MGAKDRKANEYFADNRRFADLCNATLFDGRQVILPQALETTDTTEVLSVLGMDGKEISFQKWRDLLKRVIIKKNQNVYLVLIGAELQSDIHYSMPVKDMVYAGLNYGAQVKEAGKRHKKGKEWGTKQEVEELLKRYPEKFSRLDAETVAAICLFTGIEVACEDEKEVVDLCKAWEEHRETGLREGRASGLREGRASGLREGRREERISSIRNMVELGVPKEKILIKYTLAEYEAAMKQ